jgi:hypothetical protein
VSVGGRERPLDAAPARRLAEGLGYLSEDRKGEGLALPLSVADNVTATRLRSCSRRGVLDPALQRTEQTLDDAVRAIAGTAGEARVQAHLGVKELSARWPKVERGLSDMIDDLRRAAAGARTDLDTARVKAHLAALDADHFVERAGQELKETTEELDRSTEKAAHDLQRSVSELKRRLMS